MRACDDALQILGLLRSSLRFAPRAPSTVLTPTCRWPKLLLPEKDEVKGKLLVPVLLRSGFIVAFPLLVKNPQPPLVVFLLVFVLALTNGYAASLAMVTAPKTVKGGKERVVNVMLLGLFAGLAAGSAVGTGIEALFL